MLLQLRAPLVHYFQAQDTGSEVFSDLVPDSVTDHCSQDDRDHHEPQLDVAAAGDHSSEDLRRLTGDHESDEQGLLGKYQGNYEDVSQERTDEPHGGTDQVHHTGLQGRAGPGRFYGLGETGETVAADNEDRP